MVKLFIQDVLKLADLSHISLSEKEMRDFAVELTEILDYVEQLQSVDTDGLTPTAQVTGLTNVMRKDELIDYGTTQADLLKNAPMREANYIKVKRVL